MIPNTILQVSCDEIDRDEPDGERRVARFVATELVHRIPDSARIITFDGFDGSGKSTLAGLLGANLGLTVVGLDDLLENNQRRFLEALKLKELSRRVVDALNIQGRLIIEGCLVEAALERISKTSDFRIYIMRTSRMSSALDFEWVQEHDVLYGDKSDTELISDLEETARRWASMPTKFGGGGSGKLSNLQRELILYHRERRPHDHADLIVKIVHWS